MKFIIASALVVLSLSSFASSIPDCKDRNGNVINGSIAQLKEIMNLREYNPQAYATGVISQIQKEDTNGLPHQKFLLKVDNETTLQIVSNLDFGRIPLVVGKQISVCGEYKKVGKGMIHWTHFDPHGGHPDGFSVLDGKLYGDKEIN